MQWPEVSVLLKIHFLILANCHYIGLPLSSTQSHNPLSTQSTIPHIIFFTYNITLYNCLTYIFTSSLSISLYSHFSITTMAAAVSAAVSLPSSKSTSLSTRASVINFKVSFPHRNVSSRGKVFSVRAQVTTEAPAKVEKVSKKMEEGVVVNKYRPKDPYIGKCLLNTKITGDDAPGETWHMVFTTEGEVPYREGQSIGVIADGVDKNGKPHKLRLYSIASSALGDFGDSKTVSLCVKRLVYTNDQGEIVKGVCSNFLCDLKPGNDVKITGPVGKEMLMPIDPTATVIMVSALATMY
ncbi:hypothetical protein RHMOL_Rhmol08G0039900 [Rhododendron molle]|uniref:Uncharacterized protein n=1 Tax=Rhododendron molle TaxID=49168 RepID=A0ACC0MKL7_RHOML|nr:hypothetical protein RHMOL_Rhmol08G0039900 [Rhododendron molle]